VWAGKRLIPSIFNSEDILVAERFPPLRDRLRPMRTLALLKEFHNAPERDLVVAREILSRKLTEEEFDQIFDAAPLEQLPLRVYVVMGEVFRLNKVGEFHAAIANLFNRYAKEGQGRTAPLEMILRSFRGSKEIDFSNMALDLISKGVAIRESVIYLEFRGSSVEIADKLQELPVPIELERQKQGAVREIFKRAGAWDRVK